MAFSIYSPRPLEKHICERTARVDQNQNRLRHFERADRNRGSRKNHKNDAEIHLTQIEQPMWENDRGSVVDHFPTLAALFVSNEFQRRFYDFSETLDFGLRAQNVAGDFDFDQRAPFSPKYIFRAGEESRWRMLYGKIVNSAGSTRRRDNGSMIEFSRPANLLPSRQE